MNKKKTSLLVLVVLLIAILINVVMAFNWGSGLSAYWKLDETSGTIVSSYGNHNNISRLAITQGLTGKINSGINLTNTTARVVFQNGSDWVATNGISISLWVKTSNTNDGHILGVWGNAAGATWELAQASNKVAWKTYNGANAGEIDSTGSIADGNWHHIVATYTGGTTGTNGFLYIDGILNKSGTLAYIPQSNTLYNLTMGMPQSGGGSSLIGMLDEVAIWKNRNISLSEVSELYNSGNGLPFSMSNISVSNATFSASSITYGQSVSLNVTINDSLGLGNISTVLANMIIPSSDPIYSLSGLHLTFSKYNSNPINLLPSQYICSYDSAFSTETASIYNNGVIYTIFRSCQGDGSYLSIANSTNGTHFGTAINLTGPDRLFNNNTNNGMSGFQRPFVSTFNSTYPYVMFAMYNSKVYSFWSTNLTHWNWMCNGAYIMSSASPTLQNEAFWVNQSSGMWYAIMEEGDYGNWDLYLWTSSDGCSWTNQGKFLTDAACPAIFYKHNKFVVIYADTDIDPLNGTLSAMEGDSLSSLTIFSKYFFNATAPWEFSDSDPDIVYINDSNTSFYSGSDFLIYYTGDQNLTGLAFESLNRSSDAIFFNSTNYTNQNYTMTQYNATSDIWNYTFSSPGVGQYNLSYIFANDSYAINLTSFSGLGFLVTMGASTPISSCTNITVAGNYALINNLSSTTTCINVTVPNVIIDCNNYWINYSNSNLGYGVYSNSSNTTIKNCFIYQTTDVTDYSHALFFESANNGLVYNNVIRTRNTKSHGIYFLYSNSSNISTNNYGGFNYGILLSGSTLDTIENNQVNLSGNSRFGIYLSHSLSDNLTNNNVTTSGSSESHGIYLDSSTNNILDGNNITILGVGYGLYFINLANNNVINNLHVITYGNSAGCIYSISSSSNNFSYNYLQSVGSFGFGIHLVSDSNARLSNINLTTLGNYGDGISFSTASNEKLTDVNITTTGLLSKGIKLTSSTIVNITGVNVQTNRTGSNAISIESGTNSIFALNSILNASYSGVADFVGGNGIYNFTNVTFNKSDTSMASGDLFVYWYIESFANDSSGNIMTTGNTSFYNSSGSLITFSSIGGDGYLPRIVLPEYKQNATSFYYSTNYTVNSTSGAYFNTAKLNFTGNRLNNSNLFIITFDKTIPQPIYSPPTPGNNSLQGNGTVIINVTTTDSDNYPYLAWINSTFGANTNTTPLTQSWINNTPISFEFHGLNSSVYQYNVTVCDLSGNCNSTLKRWVNVSLMNLTVYIYYPSENQILSYDPSSTPWILNFTYSIYPVFGKTLSNCSFNVTDSGGILKIPTNYLNCSGGWQNFTLSSLSTTYILNIWANQSDNEQTLYSRTFTANPTTVTPVSPGGGGGTPTPTGNVTWTMKTEQDTGNYHFSMGYGSSRTRSIKFYNTGTSQRKITLNCEGQLCNYITFTSTSIDLPVGLEIPTYSDFTVKIPKEETLSNMTANIIGTDDVGLKNILTIQVDLGSGNAFLDVLNNLPENKKIGSVAIPYWAIFLFSLVTLTLLFYLLLRMAKIQLALFLSFVLALIISFIIQIFI